jgi:transcriptional regulator with PAS, ATPase and Fis domain
MNPEIGVITPDKDLYKLVEKISLDFKEVFLIKEGYLEDSKDIAYNMEKNGIKVIVSRGGTSKKLQMSKLDIPVIDIPITEYDVLRALNEARSISNRIAIVGFDSLVARSEIIGPILGLEVKTFLVESREDIANVINRISLLGYKVVVGARIPVEKANSIGIHGILIQSQESVVRVVLGEAIKVLNAIKKEREWGQRLDVIFNSIPEGIVSFDKDGNPVDYNIIADKIFKFSELHEEEKEINNIISNIGIRKALLENQTWSGEIIEINKNKYVCNLTSIKAFDHVVGAALVFKELSEHEDIEFRVRNSLYKKGLVAKNTFDSIKYCEESIQRLVDRAKRFAQTDSTIIIEGETGTGKEIFAQSIHNFSSRKTGPFVAINCAVLPDNLLESELFGYVEGAFTGAKRGGKAGLFEIAHKGTLFLDEIGEISQISQARLLRALEERVIMRIGDDKLIPVDVRVICASNKKLEELVQKSKFRSDLFYRINILKIVIPPLRHRRKDIPLLINYFIETMSNKINNGKIPEISDEVVSQLSNYSYPGNIRELRNIIERLVVSTGGCEINSQIFSEIVDLTFDNRISFNNTILATTQNDNLFEREEFKLITRVLDECGGNKSLCSKKLGISKSTLWRKLKKIECNQ